MNQVVQPHTGGPTARKWSNRTQVVKRNISGSERLTEQERESVLSARGVPSDADASLVRFQRIMTKYRSLIRCEERILRRGDRGAASVESAQMALQIA